jgi:Stress up-regulated Nod 19
MKSQLTSLDSSGARESAREAGGTVARVRRAARVLGLAALLALAFPAGALAETLTLTLRAPSPITIGPYGVVQGEALVPSPKVDGFVVGMSATLVDAAGVELPIQNVMLHHVVFGKLGARDYTCATYAGYDGQRRPAFAERFYGLGEERTEITFPPGYGYANRASDLWGMIYMLMNHRNVRDTVYVQYTVRYVVGEPLISARPVWLDVRNCRSDPIFSVPGTGPTFSTYAQDAEFVMPESGRLVAGGAHLHGGGLRLELTNETCGSGVFTSEPTWGLPVIRPVMHENGPKHMTTFTSAAGIPVSKGDRLRLNAVYENSLPHTRVMGIMLVYLVPGAVSPCAAAPPLAPDPLSRPGAPPRVVLPLLRQPGGPLFRDLLSTWAGDFRYGHQRLSVRRGTTFRWRFLGRERHDVTLASGPVGFASPSVASGSFSFRFSRPGTYRLFCSLHPTRMTQIIRVRG